MQKKKHPVADALVFVLQFGINMLVPIGMMSLLGWWIGEKTGHTWMMIPFFFVGALAGGNGIYQMSKKTIGKDKYQYPKIKHSKKNQRLKEDNKDQNA